MKKLFCVLAVLALCLAALTVTALAAGENGWVEKADGWHYFISGEEYYKDTVTYVDGKPYYFDADGVRQDGRWVVWNTYYYYAGGDGVLRFGWLDLDGKRYYVSETSGRYGSDYAGFHYIDGKEYYFSGKGVLQTSKWVKDSAGRDYYVDGAGLKKLGWFTVSGKKYYVSDGTGRYGSDYAGFHYIDGKEYYFSGKGVLQTSKWVKDSAGRDYYVDGAGLKKLGWFTVSGKRYYVSDGTGRYADGEFDIGGKTYGFDKNGVMQTGWVRMTDRDYTPFSGLFYYGTDGAKRTGWLDLDGKRYYLDPGDGRYENRVFTIGDKNYGFDKNGVMQTGWAKLPDFFGEGSNWYCFDGEGVMRTGWVKSGKNWYYFEENGHMLTWLWYIDGQSYGFLDSGAMATGWAKIREYEGGEPVWYCFNADGTARTGWVKSGKDWYYLDIYGKMTVGPEIIDGHYYGFLDSGAMATGWAKLTTEDGPRWYRFHADGTACSGWMQDGGKWYYFGDGGAMQTGWMKDGGRWYYFKASGAMATGWQQIGGTWYYFQSSGAMVTGWMQSGDTWYYFKSSGAMAAGETVNGYTFDSSGAWIG